MDEASEDVDEEGDDDKLPNDDLCYNPKFIQNILFYLETRNIRH